jgi:hypothetical protein
LFGGGCKTVEEKGANENEIVQNRVGGKRNIPAARALSIEKHEGEEERRVADKDVAIDCKHSGNLCTIENLLSTDRKKIAVDMREDAPPSDGSQNLGRKRTCRRPPHAERQAINEEEVEANISEIHEDLERKRDIRASAPDQRANHRVVRKREGCRPDSYVEIEPRGAANIRRGVKSANAYPAYWCLGQDH